MPGGEGGGHTGDIPFSILIPACVDAVKGRISPLTGEPVVVVAAGICHFFTHKTQSLKIDSRRDLGW